MKRNSEKAMTFNTKVVDFSNFVCVFASHPWEVTLIKIVPEIWRNLLLTSTLDPNTNGPGLG